MFADVYRQRAADAKQRAAQAKDPSVKRAFEEVAAGWRVLADVQNSARSPEICAAFQRDNLRRRF
jgi:hypothetical protein